MPPPVFICASDAGHDERSPMRVYGALWAMSTIGIEWTSGVGYPRDPAGGIGARLSTQIAFPLPGGERAKGASRLFLALSWDLCQTCVRCQARSAKEDIGDPL